MQLLKWDIQSPGPHLFDSQREQVGEKVCDMIE